MDRSDWEQTDTWLENTLVTYAVAMESKEVINRIIDYVEKHKPDLLTQENKCHHDSKNTPLLMAIKNGDIDTALRLIPFYTEKDLLSLSKQGNSVLHLACYFKMNEVILAIIEQAKVRRCLNSVLSQKNIKNHTSLILYQADFEDAKPYFRRQELTRPQDIEDYREQRIKVDDKYYLDVMLIGRETHDYIHKFNEEVTKHKFNYKDYSEKIICYDIERALTPSLEYQEFAEIKPSLTSSITCPEPVITINTNNTSSPQEIYSTPEIYGKGKDFWEKMWEKNYSEYQPHDNDDIEAAEEHSNTDAAEALLYCYGGLWSGTTYGSEVSSEFKANCMTLHELFTKLKRVIHNGPIKKDGDLHTILKVIGEKVHNDENHFVIQYGFNIVEREKKKSFYESFLSLFCCFSSAAEQEEVRPTSTKGQRGQI